MVMINDVVRYVEYIRISTECDDVTLLLSDKVLCVLCVWSDPHYKFKRAFTIDQIEDMNEAQLMEWRERLCFEAVKLKEAQANDS